MRQGCNFRHAAIAASGLSHAATRARLCCLLFSYMAGLSGQPLSFFALLWCFKKHGWVLGRVRNAYRLARNGETPCQPISDHQCLKEVYLASHKSPALRCTVLPLRRHWMGFQDLASRRAVMRGDDMPLELNVDHQQCVSAVTVAFVVLPSLQRTVAVLRRRKRLMPPSVCRVIAMHNDTHSFVFGM
jgi:hypothetical protein